MSDLTGTLVCAGEVMTLKLNDLTLACKLPRGDRGPPGRDGMNIKGDKGDKGDIGDAGRDGRDSVVPGPKGDTGAVGGPGAVPNLRVGRVVVGEDASATVTMENPLLYSINLVIPRGHTGKDGPGGRDGKHGNHEYIQFNSFGNNPSYTREMLDSYFFADGNLALPEMKEDDCGKWFCCKTLHTFAVSGCVEGAVTLNKNDSGKFVVIPYSNKFMFTKF
jgi:hypothetical protein